MGGTAQMTASPAAPASEQAAAPGMAVRADARSAQRSTLRQELQDWMIRLSLRDPAVRLNRPNRTIRQKLWARTIRQYLPYRTIRQTGDNRQTRQNRYHQKGANPCMRRV